MFLTPTNLNASDLVSGYRAGTATEEGGTPNCNPHIPGKMNIVEYKSDGTMVSREFDASLVDKDEFNNHVAKFNVRQGSKEERRSRAHEAMWTFAEKLNKKGLEKEAEEFIDFDDTNTTEDVIKEPQPISPKPQRSSLASQIHKTRSNKMNLSERIDTVTEPLKPTKKVTLEIPVAGQFEAYYHEAFVEGDFVILAYDTSYTAGMKYFPPPMDSNQLAEEDQPDILLDIDNDSRVYGVMSRGIQFSFRKYDICVLPIQCAVEKDD